MVTILGKLSLSTSNDKDSFIMPDLSNVRIIRRNVVCEYCQEALPQGRITKRFHEKCRQKMWREKRKIEKRCDRVCELVRNISEYIKYDVTQQEAIACLKAISEALNTVYRENNIVRIK